MFLELHMLQSFPPANLNRDDSNNPKDCDFGGVRRARISSQCLKRAMRTAPVFGRTTRTPNAVRTRRIVDKLAQALVEAGKDPGAADAVVKAFVADYLTKLDRRHPELTDVLVYISEDELRRAREALEENWEVLAGDTPDTKVLNSICRDLRSAFKVHTSAPDIALFGRMLAANPELNLDASCQVAHAISTHRITMEMDFFTALDDLQLEEEPGAGMMGFTSYDSACFYRYMRIDWNQLLRNLDGDTALAQRTVEGFLRAAEDAVPSGKQNSFAALNPPSLMLAVVRRDGMGWSLANAYERPVRADREGGLVGPSITALDGYWGQLCVAYGTDTLACVAARVLDADVPIEHLRPHLTLGRDQWLQGVLDALPAEEAVS